MNVYRFVAQLSPLQLHWHSGRQLQCLESPSEFNSKLMAGSSQKRRSVSIRSFGFSSSRGSSNNDNNNINCDDDDDDDGGSKSTPSATATITFNHSCVAAVSLRHNCCRHDCGNCAGRTKTPPTRQNLSHTRSRFLAPARLKCRSALICINRAACDATTTSTRKITSYQATRGPALSWPPIDDVPHN